MKKLLIGLILTLNLFAETPENNSCIKELFKSFDLKTINSDEHSKSSLALSFDCNQEFTSEEQYIKGEGRSLKYSFADSFGIKAYGTLAEKKEINNEPIGIDLSYNLRYSLFKPLQEKYKFRSIDMGLFTSAKRLQIEDNYSYLLGANFLFNFKKDIKQKYFLPSLGIKYTVNKDTIFNNDYHYRTFNPTARWKIPLHDLLNNTNEFIEKSELALYLDYKKRYSLNDNIKKIDYDEAFLSKFRYDYKWEKKFEEFEIYSLFLTIKSGKEELSTENNTNINFGINLKLY